MTPHEIAAFLDDIRTARHRLTQPDLPANSVATHYADLAQRDRGNTAIANRVVVLADLWTLVGAEQLGAVAALLHVGATSFGMFPLARSILEHSAATTWVLDPKVSPEGRCARAALAIDRSNVELVTAASHLGGKGEVYMARRKVMRQHRADLQRDFPDGTKIADGTPKQIANETLLSPTALLRHQAEFGGYSPEQWEGVYDYLCATANHPTLAAFEHFTELKDGGLRPELSGKMLDRLIRVVVASHLMSLQAYAAFCGWDQAEVHRLREQSSEMFP